MTKREKAKDKYSAEGKRKTVNSVIRHMISAREKEERPRTKRFGKNVAPKFA